MLLRRCVSLLTPKTNLGACRSCLVGFSLHHPSHIPNCLILHYTGLTDSVLKDIKQSCASLSAFSLSYEQICNISVYPSLPRTLTSLSLPYCNISMHNFDSLFSPGMLCACCCVHGKSIPVGSSKLIIASN